MVFGDKLSFGKSFTCSDLLQFIEELVKISKFQQRRSSVNNYEWLKCRSVENIDLEQFKNVVFKLSSESCTAIAVKLDRLIDENNLAPNEILPTFQNLLEEQEHIQIIQKNVKHTKEKKVNKVYPELEGKSASVSFILK